MFYIMLLYLLNISLGCTSSTGNNKMGIPSINIAPSKASEKDIHADTRKFSLCASKFALLPALKLLETHETTNIPEYIKNLYNNIQNGEGVRRDNCGYFSRANMKEMGITSGMTRDVSTAYDAYTKEMTNGETITNDDKMDILFLHQSALGGEASAGGYVDIACYENFVAREPVEASNFIYKKPCWYPYVFMEVALNTSTAEPKSKRAQSGATALYLMKQMPALHPEREVWTPLLGIIIIIGGAIEVWEYSLQYEHTSDFKLVSIYLGGFPYVSPESLYALIQTIYCFNKLTHQFLSNLSDEKSFVNKDMLHAPSRTVLIEDDTVYKVYDYRGRDHLVLTANKRTPDVYFEFVHFFTDLSKVIDLDGLKVIKYKKIEGSHTPKTVQHLLDILLLIKVMIERGYVHGDIRLYNMIFIGDGINIDNSNNSNNSNNNNNNSNNVVYDITGSDYIPGKFAKLIDFDFAGEAGVKYYPGGYAKVPDAERHPGAVGGEKLQYCHDIHSFVSVCKLFALSVENTEADNDVWNNFFGSVTAEKEVPEVENTSTSSTDTDMPPPKRLKSDEKNENKRKVEEIFDALSIIKGCQLELLAADLSGNMHTGSPDRA